MLGIDWSTFAAPSRTPASARALHADAERNADQKRHDDRRHRHPEVIEKELAEFRTALEKDANESIEHHAASPFCTAPFGRTLRDIIARKVAWSIEPRSFSSASTTAIGASLR